MTPEEARTRARAASHLSAFISFTREMGAGPSVAVKDIIDVAGSVTTGGGAILPTQPAPEDAPVIAELRAHGCSVMGKTNLHEWAFGATSMNPHYGIVRNPHDVTRIAGGSSGGSAVAVAAELCDWAIGTDTGGSIRMPAALCGVVGVKPTFGTVSTARVIPVSRSLDTVGALAPDVRTAARALEMMSGLEGLVPRRTKSASAFRLAVPRDWIVGLDSETAEVWGRVSEGLRDVRLPDLGPMVDEIPGTIHRVEALEFHRKWVERCPERYGADVLEGLRRGLTISRSDYVRALYAQRRLTVEVGHAMSGCDALLLPTTPCVAPPITEVTNDVRLRLVNFTRPFSITGQPVVSIPAASPVLPIGIQVVGHFGRDAELMEVALALEERWQREA